MKRSVKIGIGAGVVVVLALGGGFVVKSRQKKLVEVTTAKVERADLVSKVSANGQIEAKRKVDLSAHVMGQIVNLAVREGDVVKKGDFLLQIDKTQLEASAAGAAASLSAMFNDRDAARSTMQERQREFARAKNNYDEKIVPLAEYERARSALESAQANLSAAENRIAQSRAALAGARDTLSKTTLTAPMAGIVTRLPVEEGEVAVLGTMNNPGTVLLTISDMSEVEAVMEVDETDIPNVKIGQLANVTIDAYPNRTFTGRVTEVGSSPISAVTSGAEAINFEVKIQLDAPPPGVRPGFSVSADVVTGTRSKVVNVPIQALVVREKPGKSGGKPVEEEGIYAFDPATKKIAFTPIKTGITGETTIEVVSGIEPGKEIVTGPFRALREVKDGDEVKIAKDEKKKGGPEADQG
jgi:HlyD family secretion protein